MSSRRQPPNPRRARARNPDGRAAAPPAGGAPPRPAYTGLAHMAADFRARADAGETQDDILRVLCREMDRIGVRVRHDVLARAKPAAAAPPLPAPLPPAGPEAAPAAPDDSADEFPTLGGAPAESPASTRRRPPAGRGRAKMTAVPVSIIKGHLVVQFDDPALQPPVDLVRPAAGRADRPPADTDACVGRVILSGARRVAAGAGTLRAECNGAILDARTWQILAAPPRAFVTHPAAAKMDAHLAAGAYDIIQVSDGTVVTLYQWGHPTKGPIWCLGTSNGYDVSHLKWMGGATYAECLYELLAAVPGFVAETGAALVRDYLCAGDVRLQFGAGLAPGYSYTVGFRHGNFHPLDADPPGVWNIQAAETASGALLYGPGAVGLPLVRRQATFAPADVRALAGLPADGPVTMEVFGLVAQSSLAAALAAIAAGPPYPVPAVEAGPADGPAPHVSAFNYGFILRLRDPEVDDARPDVLVETDLLVRVRQLVYQQPAASLRIDLTPANRLEYTAMTAYLTAGDRETYLALFPRFAPRFHAYAEFVANVVNAVHHMYRQRMMAPAARTSDGVVPTTRTETVAKSILTLIYKNEPSGLRVFNDDARNIIEDFVVQPEYAYVYLRALGSGP